MPELFIITDEWNEQLWMNTGGTRAKKYLQAPSGKFYYFKRSQLKPGKDYTFEFWSEVIAYETGKLLGFDILKYDIAIYGDLMGCISESMINSEEEELIEGVKYLQAFAPGYDPTSKSHQNRYTFHLIENSLENAKLKGEIENIIELIVFDALIGNGDRHQENWAIISKQQLITTVIEKIAKEEKLKLSKLTKFMLKIINKVVDQNAVTKIPKALYHIEKRFAPIYDSGSSLGRELLNTKVDLLLNSEEELMKYIEKGQSEIHWNENKIGHFELIGYLLNSAYKEKVITVIKRVATKWDSKAIENIINEIDQKVPASHYSYKIPENRKKLISKIITSRQNRLQELIHAGV